MIIVGAGMSGLLAAHMLRRFSPVIYEAQPSLPNNHSALLRFRSDVVSRATGIPFKKVWVEKAICYKGQILNQGNLALNNMYASKVAHSIVNRSIMNLEPGYRWVAPMDFISQMSNGLDIRYDHSIGKQHLISNSYDNLEPVISTVPMADMMRFIGWKNIPEFEYQGITTLSCELEKVDVYQTIYYPNPAVRYYRASITGNRLMIEMVGSTFDLAEDVRKDFINSVLKNFGLEGRRYSLPEVKMQKYGKIIPIDNSVRKQFILAMTDKHRIYSIGRFATWRQLLMDDVVNDVHLVEQMITERSSYVSQLQSA